MYESTTAPTGVQHRAPYVRVTVLRTVLYYEVYKFSAPAPCILRTSLLVASLTTLSTPLPDLAPPTRHNLLL